MQVGLAKLNANSQYGYDAVYGVKAMGTTNAVLISTALSETTKYTPLATLDRSGTAVSTVNITFSLVKNLTVAGVNDPGGVTFGDPTTGDVVIIYDIENIGNPVRGSDDFQVLLHEIGHGLGLFTGGELNHPHEIAPTEHYTHDNTIMSYLYPQLSGPNQATYPDFMAGSVLVEGRDASTGMLYDIVTLQKLYGVNTTTNGNNTVPVTGTKKAWTLWDSGGADTLDVSGLPWTAGQPGAKLDLRGGVDANNVPRFSEIKDERIAIAFDPRHYTNGDITQPLLPGKSGVVEIENAKGGAGDDTIINGYGAHTLDTLQGGGGADKIYSGKSSFSGDQLYGDTPGSTVASGADVLWGTSNDVLYGGPGADKIWMNESTAYHHSGADTYYAYSGSNFFNFEAGVTSASGVTFEVEHEGAQLFLEGGNYTGATLKIGNQTIAGTFRRTDTKPFKLNDDWTAQHYGLGMRIYNKAGEVVVDIDNWSNGYFGLNFLNEAGGSATIGAIGAVPRDIEFVKPYLEAARQGTSAADTVQGTVLAEALFGYESADAMLGNRGNDTLDGGKGNNTLTGGADSDRFVIAVDTVAATDTIMDYNPLAGEVIDLSAFGSNLSVELVQTGADVSFVIGGNHTVILKNVGSTPITSSNFTGVTSVARRVIPTSGSESITGSAAANTIDGLAGNDTISGLGGNDSLYGNSGDDLLIGGAGADTLNGGSGSDTASYAGSASVSVNLATGAVSGGYAAGDVFSSIEHLIGSGNADTLAGNTSSNRILGGGGNDTILGDSGNDTLDGEAGNDSIDGGAGNDLIYGGTGSDWMIGGTGTDTLDYSRSTAAVILNLTTGTASGGWAAGDNRNVFYMRIAC